MLCCAPQVAEPRAASGLKAKTRYRRVARLGRGVCVAKCRKTSKLVVLKRRVLDCELDLLKRGRGRSEWLVQLDRAFPHPEQLDQSIVVMEYVSGGDLRMHLNRRGILPEPEAAVYLFEMGTAANALHSMGYVHRDLKPENFLITRDGHLKLADFGSAARVPECTRNLCLHVSRPQQQLYQLSSLWSSLDHGALNSKRGSSFAYAAPELLRNPSAATFAADYWSLGCILYELLAYWTPFCHSDDDSAVAVCERILHLELHRPTYDEEDAHFSMSDSAWSAIQALLAPQSSRVDSYHSFGSIPFIASAHAR